MTEQLRLKLMKKPFEAFFQLLGCFNLVNKGNNKSNNTLAMKKLKLNRLSGNHFSKEMKK